jgi:hypothetical protein
VLADSLVIGQSVRVALRSRSLIVASLVVVGAAVVGCGSAGSPRATPSPSHRETDAASATSNVHLLAWPKNGEPMREQMTALIQGGVHIDTVNDCVVIRVANETFPIVWPRGTSMLGDRIHLPGGTTVGEGERVRGGGGFLQIAAVNQIVSTSLTMPTSCRAASGEVAVFNQNEPVATA